VRFRARTAPLAVVLVAAAALGASATASQPAAPCGWGTRPPKTYKHVITIVLENHTYSQVAHDSPYLNSLARRCGLASNYSAIRHPSLPNYLALTSGDTDGITSDCTGCSTSARSIFGQVGPRGWRAYEESLPSVGYTGGRSGRYAKKHNPAAYFTSVASAYGRNAVPLETTLPGDLKGNRLPRYSFVTPDLCNDEHDCDVSTGDRWLEEWVPKILASPAYRDGATALFITYDEGNHSDNRIYTVVVSPSTRPGTVSNQKFDHYSLLKTEEALLGLPCLAHACDGETASLRSAFGL
jgi:phospholipase C